jgi:heme/copper-type cytochrome/quinol oxidase subunit 2
MKINSYKIIWIAIGLVIVAGISLGCFLFSQKIPKENTPETTTIIPDYKEGKVPGEIVVQFPEPNLSGENNEGNSGNLVSPEQDESLSGGGEPIMGAAIKAPDEPALPPSEDEITKVSIKNGEITPTQIDVKINDPVILSVSSQDKDYSFYIEGIGVAENILANQSMGISFRAPNKKTSLKYYCEDYKTKDRLGEGSLVVN